MYSVQRIATTYSEVAAPIGPQHLQHFLNLNVAMTTRPDPLIEPFSFNSSKREVMFFNPALVPPSSLTPGLTPFPASKSPPLAVSSSGKRPWVVSPPPPPPPASSKAKLGGVGRTTSSSCQWIKRDPDGRGLCSMALRLLLGAVLFVVALGVRVADAMNMLMFSLRFAFWYGWKRHLVLIDQNYCTYTSSVGCTAVSRPLGVDFGYCRNYAHFHVHAFLKYGSLQLGSETALYSIV